MFCKHLQNLLVLKVIAKLFVIKKIIKKYMYIKRKIYYNIIK